MTEQEQYDPGADLAEVTTNLGGDYVHWKYYEDHKKISQAKFFELATAEFGDDDLAEKLVTVFAEDEAQARKRAAAHNPGWHVDDLRETDRQPSRPPAVWDVILVEDASLKPFTYVNKEDGQVYKRSVRKGSLWLDEEYLKELDPDLYEEIVFRTPWGAEIIPPLETLSAKLTGRLQGFIFQGKPSVSLTAPRAAKPEEMK